MTLTVKELECIARILKSGNNVELKKVNGEIQIIEIQRKLKMKTPIQAGDK